MREPNWRLVPKNTGISFYEGHFGPGTMIARIKVEFESDEEKGTWENRHRVLQCEREFDGPYGYAPIEMAELMAMFSRSLMDWYRQGFVVKAGSAARELKEQE